MEKEEQRIKFGALMKEKRIRKCLSQDALAQKIQCCPSVISRVEAGKVIPSGITLLALIKVLGFSIQDLLNVYF